MSEENKDVKSVDAVEEAQPVALMKIQKMADGSVSYHFGGPDADVLGLVEFAKLMIEDRTRMNIAIAQAKAQAEASKAAADANPSS